MKVISLLAVLGATLSLNSCSIAKSLIQIPVRTLQTVGRSVGVGIEHSEEQALQKSADPEASEKKIDAR